MPKTKFQEVVFTILMVFVMVYAMICYNIALNIGGMSNEVFLSTGYYGTGCICIGFLYCRKSCKKESVPNCACRTGQSFSSGAGNFCSICNMDVSADESGGNTVI